VAVVDWHNGTLMAQYLLDSNKWGISSILSIGSGARHSEERVVAGTRTTTKTTSKCHCSLMIAGVDRVLAMGCHSLYSG
jgi:hypothetical protein